MKSLVPIILIGFLLAGCAKQIDGVPIEQLSMAEAMSPALRADKVDDVKCRSYGAVKGDPAYVQCRAQLAASRNVAGAVESAAPRSGPDPFAPPPPLPPITYYPANHR